MSLNISYFQTTFYLIKAMKYVSCKSQMFTQVNETPDLNNVKQWRQFSTRYLPPVLALSV